MCTAFKYKSIKVTKGHCQVRRMSLDVQNHHGNYVSEQYSNIENICCVHKERIESQSYCDYLICLLAF